MCQLTITLICCSTYRMSCATLEWKVSGLWIYLYLMQVTAFLPDEDYYKKRVVAVRPGLIPSLRPSTHCFMLKALKNKDVAVRARKDFNVGGSSTKVRINCWHTVVLLMCVSAPHNSPRTKTVSEQH